MELNYVTLEYTSHFGIEKREGHSNQSYKKLVLIDETKWLWKVIHQAWHEKVTSWN